MANAPSLLIGPKDNSKYAGVTAPAGYQFGKTDKTQQMWAGGQLVDFRPLVPTRQYSNNGLFGSSNGFDRLLAAYGRKPAAAPAPTPAPVIQGGAAILTGGAGNPAQASGSDEQQMWKGNKLVPFKAGAKVPPVNGTTLLLGD